MYKVYFLTFIMCNIVSAMNHEENQCVPPLPSSNVRKVPVFKRSPSPINGKVTQAPKKKGTHEKKEYGHTEIRRFLNKQPFGSSNSL